MLLSELGKLAMTCSMRPEGGDDIDQLEIVQAQVAVERQEREIASEMDLCVIGEVYARAKKASVVDWINQFFASNGGLR